MAIGYRTADGGFSLRPSAPTRIRTWNKIADNNRPSIKRSDGYVIIYSPSGIDFEHVFENFSANVRVRVKNSFVFELLLFDCQYIIIHLKYSLCFYANFDTS